MAQNRVEMSMFSLGELTRLMQAELDVSPAQLAVKLGVDTPAISAMEADERPATSEDLETFARAFKRKSAELLCCMVRRKYPKFASSEFFPIVEQLAQLVED